MNASPSADDINRDFQKAVEHYQGNRFAEATALLDRLAPHCGGRAEYFRLRGHIAMRNRDPAAALTALQRAAELAPRAALHQFELGEHYRMSGKPAEAIRLYRQALALEPGAAIVRIALAGVLALTGNARAAIGEVDQAVAAAGDNLQALLAARACLSRPEAGGRRHPHAAPRPARCGRTISRSRPSCASSTPARCGPGTSA